jgi:hypothetical protein
MFTKDKNFVAFKSHSLNLVGWKKTPNSPVALRPSRTHDSFQSFVLAYPLYSNGSKETQQARVVGKPGVSQALALFLITLGFS